MGRGRSSSGGSRGSSSSSSSRGRSYSSSSRYRSLGSSVSFVGGTSSGATSIIVPILVGVIFAVVGLYVSIMGIVQCSEASQYASVQAECVQNDYIDGWYYTTYNYTVNGKDYTNMSKEGWEKAETLGEVVTIYYLKDNPNIITEKEPDGVGENVVLIIFGLVFAGFGALPIILTIKQIKANKQLKTSQVETNSTIEPTKATTIKCLYCGSVYDQTNNSCPNCGAGKQEN